MIAWTGHGPVPLDIPAGCKARSGAACVEAGRPERPPQAGGLPHLSENRGYARLKPGYLHGILEVMNWTAAGATALALAVVIGAFGAHGLKGRLDDYSLTVYERAVFYHFVHALGILIVSAMLDAGKLPRSAGAWVCWLLLAGVVLFSGSLYALALTGQRILGAITPLGGVSFIAAWVLLAVTALRARPPAP